MFDLLTSVGGSVAVGGVGAAFDEMPLFQVAMNEAEAALGGSAAGALDLVWVAASLLSASVESMDDPANSVSSKEAVAGVEVVPVDPVGTGEDCDIADHDISQSGKLSVEIPGVSVVVVAAETNLNADCKTDNCISGTASIARSIRATVEDGSGCPSPWLQWGTYSYEAAVEFKAESGTGHCTNGVPDVAQSGSVHASGGGFSAELIAAMDTGNGLSAKAGVEGRIKVCMDDDLIFDDITDVIVTGRAIAQVD